MADSSFLKKLLTALGGAWISAAADPLHGRQQAQALDASISSAGIVPIGAIIPWVQVGALALATYLPPNFMKCDGSVVNDSDSPMNGLTLPNLNGTGTAQDGYFLRGTKNDYQSGIGQADNVRQHTHTFAGNPLGTHQHNAAGTPTGGAFFGPNAALGSTSQQNIFTAAVSAGTPSGTNSNYPTAAGTPNETYPKNVGVIWLIRIK